MMSTVLVPTDLGAAQEWVMRFCSGLGSLGVTRVVCCHVVDATGLEGPVIAAKMDASRKALKRAVEPIEAAGLEVWLRVSSGEPERELTLVAAEEHIDAIVAGSSGKHPLDRMFVGSVVERLARDGGIPSLSLRYDMLRASGDPAELARRFGRLLLIPTDFSDAAERATDLALSFPKAAIGNIRLLNVAPAGSSAEESVEAELKRAVDRAKALGIHATPVVGHGAPEKAIISEIASCGITGVVMGSRGRSTLQQALMGSVSMTLIRQATVPVLIVP
jgi:nucleotide-binding universal stress UspA family protein